MEKRIAILLTCHNRRDKTVKCLRSLYQASCPAFLKFTIFLVDDGCTDGTSNYVHASFPEVNIVEGNGSLYWAGGMRLAWRTALESGCFDAFLLLNDDVELKPDVFSLLIECHDYAISHYGTGGLYSAATLDQSRNTTSYGGRRLIKNSWRVISRTVDPLGFPQSADMLNANILWVENSVVERIGILSEKFTHGIADYEYSLAANESKIPVLLASCYGGYCANDHGKSFMKQATPLMRRIDYLKSPTGLAYEEYLFFVRKYFPLSLPYSFLMLWAKTLIPALWEKLK